MCGLPYVRNRVPRLSGSPIDNYVFGSRCKEVGVSLSGQATCLMGAAASSGSSPCRLGEYVALLQNLLADSSQCSTRRSGSGRRRVLASVIAKAQSEATFSERFQGPKNLLIFGLFWAKREVEIF